MDKRLNLIQSWLNSEIGLDYDTIEPASADASFRRYFRIRKQSSDPQSWIVMDAPPEHEDNERFIRCAATLRNCGLNAPEVKEQDLQQGFLLLSDLGATTYQDKLNNQTADWLYSDALAALLRLQNDKQSISSYPAYNSELLQDEMNLFEQWYVEHHLKTRLNEQQKSILSNTCQLLIDSACEQPLVLVHRDYHCRNLLVNDLDNPGVVDFQDMVVGPITYDLVSLLKDCYIEWPRERVLTWLEDYRLKAVQHGLIDDIAREKWVRWFDWMGAQRHLKVLGIFARLNYRDGKAQYLEDLPLVNRYLANTCQAYPELLPLADLLEALHEPG